MSDLRDDTGEDFEDDVEQSPEALSRKSLIPIGIGVGAIAMLALFFGYRVATPEASAVTDPADGAGGATTIVGTGEIEGLRDGTAGEAPDAMMEATAGETADEAPDVMAEATADETTDETPDAMAEAAVDEAADAATADMAGAEDDDYVPAEADAVAALPAASLAADADTVASLETPTDDGTAIDGVPDGDPPREIAGIEDPVTRDLFGGEIMMVSSTDPRVVMLTDGTELVPGQRLPGGHRIVDILRERILLERDGQEWGVRIP